MNREEKTTIALLSFSETGCALALVIAQVLSRGGLEASVFCKSKYAPEAADRKAEKTEKPGQPARAEAWEGSLAEWTGERFGSCRALIFVGAAGIAVRAVAPFVQDKQSDPAVLAVDEAGHFVIPLLSGHLGGANALAKLVAEGIGALPVITTATDLRGAFAADSFAKEHGLWISDKILVKEISAAILHGERVLLTFGEELGELPAGAALPDGLALSGECRLRIHIGIGWDERLPGRTLYLVPRAAVLGIGCKKNTPCGAIREHTEAMLRENRVFLQAVCAVSTIDLKKEEPGLLQFVCEEGLEFFAFSAQELQNVPGRFSASAFVERTTGADNVCERSAVLASGGRLRIRKTAGSGVTAALAVRSVPQMFG